MAKKPIIINGQKVLRTELFETQVKAISEDEIEVIGSTGAMDRDGEVVEPTAWDLKNFKKNPVILAGHDYRSPAIARATSVKLEDNKLKFKIKFPTEGAYPLADIYRKLYKEGIMSATSVGFIAREWQDGDGKAGKPWRTYSKTELLELSLVTVPSNPEALVLQRGILNDEEMAAFKKSLEGGKHDEVGSIPEVEAVKEESDLESLKAAVAELQKTVGDHKIALDQAQAEIKELKSALEKNSNKKHYLDIDDPAERGGLVDADILKEAASEAFK